MKAQLREQTRTIADLKQSLIVSVINTCNAILEVHSRINNIGMVKVALIIYVHLNEHALHGTVGIFKAGVTLFKSTF